MLGPLKIMVMLILLITHVSIALASIVIATRGLLRPSRVALKHSYAAVAATLTTGTILVIASRSDVLQSCITGLTYLAAMTVATAITHYRLATERTK